MFLVEGLRAIDQIHSVAPMCIEEILCDFSSEAVAQWGYPIRILTKQQYKSISSHSAPQGIAALVQIPAQTYTDQLPESMGERIVVLEDVQDPGNVGTLIRTAAAFGYSGVLLSGQCADPFSTKVVQASAGAILSIWLRRTPSYVACIEQCQSRGYAIIATDLNGTADVPFQKLQKHALLLGNEGAGLSDALLQKAQHSFRLPFEHGKIESLNVAVSGAVCMFLGSGYITAKQV